MIRALRITPDNSCTELLLPDDDGVGALIRASVGGPADQGVYHRQALFHVHGDGAASNLPPNLTAWALACAWRGLELPYVFHGRVVVTGPSAPGGTVETLEDLLAKQTGAAAESVAAIIAEWEKRPPVSGGVGTQEILADVRRAVRVTV